MKIRKIAVPLTFVVLLLLSSIGMGVGVYMFYNQLDEIQPKLVQEEKNITNKQTEIDKTIADIGTLKKLIGCSPEMRKEFVFNVVEQDLQKVNGENATIALTLEENEKVYEVIIKKLFDMIQEQKTVLGQRQKELEDLKLLNISREQSNDKKLVAMIESSQKEQKALLDVLTKSDTTRLAINQAKVEIYDKLDKIFKDNEQAFVETNQKIDAANKRIGELQEIHSDLTKVATKVSRKSLSRPDGRILSCNPVTKVAIISLGSNSNLRLQTTFDVYAANATTSTATPKGTVLVRQVGETQSQTVVTEYSTSNPIVAGDIIFTKDWTPGDHKRYALCGILDITGDKKNDLSRILSYIQLHGDVCDAYLDGTSVHGSIVPEIDYYVLGERPDEEKSPAEAKAYDAFINQVKRYNIPEISVQELMRQIETQELTNQSGTKVQMGVKSSTPNYGVSRGKDNTFRSRTGSRVMPR